MNRAILEEKKMTADTTYKYRGKKKRKIDFETVYVTCLMACIAAVGVIAVFAVITGSDIYGWGIKKLAGLYLILCGSIWGGLLMEELCKLKNQ